MLYLTSWQLFGMINLEPAGTFPASEMALSFMIRFTSVETGEVSVFGQTV
jgi:hypothetical protein